MKLACHLLAVMSFLTLLGGCSNIGRLDLPPGPPSPEGKYEPSVKTIVERVRCEIAPLADRAREINLTEGDWVVAVQLTVDVINDGSLAPTFTYINGPFSFNAGARYDLSREHNVVIDQLYSIKGIAKELDIEREAKAKRIVGADGPSRFACPSAINTNLAGELSITESADMALRAGDLNVDVAPTASTGVFGGYVQFIVTKNLNAVGPTWMLTHLKGPGSLAGISEVNTDKLVFAFAQAKPADGKSGQSNAAQIARAYITNININQLTVAFPAVRSNL